MLVHNPLIRPAISWQVVALGGFTQTCVAHRFDENGIFTYKFTIKINQRQVNMPSSIVSETWLLRGFWKHSFFEKHLTMILVSSVAIQKMPSILLCCLAFGPSFLFQMWANVSKLQKEVSLHEKLPVASGIWPEIWKKDGHILCLSWNIVHFPIVFLPLILAIYQLFHGNPIASRP